MAANNALVFKAQMFHTYLCSKLSKPDTTIKMYHSLKVNGLGVTFNSGYFSIKFTLTDSNIDDDMDSYCFAYKNPIVDVIKYIEISEYILDHTFCKKMTKNCVKPNVVSIHGKTYNLLCDLNAKTITMNYIPSVGDLYTEPFEVYSTTMDNAIENTNKVIKEINKVRSKTIEKINDCCSENTKLIMEFIRNTYINSHKKILEDGK